VAYPRLIPCLDVADGRVVKGIQFQSLRDVGDPVELAAAYSERGADELVLLDIKASLRGVRALIDVVERVADAVTIPLTVGGGVRTCEDAQRLIEAGADRVSINTAALDRPALLGEVAALFGSQAVVAAIDTRAGEVFSHAGTTPTGIDVFAWARRVVTEGAGEILLTAIDADGRQAGYDLLTKAGMRAAVTVGVIA
jgi:imidazole glycerol-phosphate synthase subunit HisF